MIAYAALIDDQSDLMRFNELVEKYQTEMFRIARSILSDHHLAEDAVQNALYGIAVSYRSIPSDDSAAAHAYMLSCAKYAALRLKKTQQRYDTADIEALRNEARTENPTFEAIRQDDDYDRLIQAIGQLDEPYQDVLLHFYVFDQSVREISKLFGRKPSTVRQQLARARKRLEEICRKEGILHG